MPSTQTTVPCGLLKLCRFPRGATNMDPATALPRHIIPGHQQPAAQDIDRLIEFIVRVRDRPGEVSRDGDLHGREPGRLILMTGKDVDRLPAYRKAGAAPR